MKYIIKNTKQLRKKGAQKLPPAFNPFIKELSAYSSSEPCFDSQETYSGFISTLHSLLKKYPQQLGISGKLFKSEIHDINRGAPLAKAVEWGGITYKLVDVEKNKIKKLLVVKAGGTLGFEYHDFKHEKLEVLEGVCLYISSIHGSRDWKKGEVTIQIASVGDTATLLPGDEHGLIAITDCVVLETSTNHLEDLKYIFTSKQPSFKNK